MNYFEVYCFNFYVKSTLNKVILSSRRDHRKQKPLDGNLEVFFVGYVFLIYFLIVNLIIVPNCQVNCNKLYSCLTILTPQYNIQKQVMLQCLAWLKSANADLTTLIAAGLAWVTLQLTSFVLQFHLYIFLNFQD